LFGWAALGILRCRIECSVSLQWLDVGLTTYAVLCVLSFIWARHMHIRIINWIRTKYYELHYSTYTQRHLNSENCICGCPFHRQHRFSSFLDARCVSLKHDTFNSLRLQPILCKVNDTSHHSLLLSRMLAIVFCSRFFHKWCTSSALGVIVICRTKWYTVYISSYWFKQIFFTNLRF